MGSKAKEKAYECICSAIKHRHSVATQTIYSGTWTQLESCTVARVDTGVGVALRGLAERRDGKMSAAGQVLLPLFGCRKANGKYKQRS